MSSTTAVPSDVIAKLASESGLSQADVSHIAEHAVLFVDTIKQTGVGLTIVRTWACIRCVFSIGPVRKVFWCLVCYLIGGSI